MLTCIKNIILASLLTLGFISKAQPVLVWAKQFNIGHIVRTGINHDNSGNVYSVGDFYGVVDFDPSPGVHTLTSVKPQQTNVFLTKLDSNGNFVWAKQIKGASSSIYTAPLIDDSGNVFITGNFRDTIDFDPGPGVFKLIASPTKIAVFILKLNSSGDFIWAKKVDGTGIAIQVESIATDDFKHIYLTGWFQGIKDFNPGPAVFNLNALVLDFFILKLDSSGNFIWAKQSKGPGNVNMSSISYNLAFDLKGNIYATGFVDGKIDMDPGPDTAFLSIPPKNNVFILKLDSSGNFIWVKGIAFEKEGGAYCIKVDPLGNIYTTGYFRGTADFDMGPGNYTITQQGVNPDLFIYKIDSSGSFNWVKQIPTEAFYDFSRSLNLDFMNNLYVSGTFSGNVDFDPGPGTFMMNTHDSDDGFILKLNTDGNFEWAERLGDKDRESSFFTVVDSNYLYASGVGSHIDFNPDDSLVYYFTDTLKSAFNLKWGICNSNARINATFCDSFQFNNRYYKTTGQYKKVIPNFRGCDSIITLNLVKAKPKAKLTLQTKASCQDIEYTFTDSSSVDTVSPAGFMYQLDYGDHNSAFVNSPTRIKDFKHVYTKSGSYLVRLIFGNGFCTDTFTFINNVIILPAPKPGFTLNGRKGCTPFVLNIRDTFKTNILLKEYDFGNGFVSLNNNKALNTTLQINSTGTYIIRQRLTGITGCLSEWIDTIIVIPGLTKLDTVNVLYTTVIDSNTTFTKWEALPLASSYTIKNTNTTDTFFTDHNVQPNAGSLHYFVSAKDNCGNKTALSPVEYSG